jgi:putative PEP-CTERM system histidine kinase
MSFIALSYGAAAVAYGLLTVVLLVRREVIAQGHRVLLAVIGTAIWGGVIALAFVLPVAAWRVVAPAADAARVLVWIVALLAAVPAQATWNSMKGFVLVIAGFLTSGVVVAALLAPTERFVDVALLALSILGCLTVEQIFRNSTPEQKRVLTPFLWTIGAMFVYDLFVYADSALLSGVDPVLWAPRGFIAATAVPFFVLAAKRHPDWTETLFVSREFVFYSATLTGAGIYLLSIGAGGLIIREAGGQWGPSIQIAYLVAALGLLGYVLSSTRLKAQLRVFISKHFYRNRYDYREEWLRLIRTLSDEALPLEQRSIKALADIVHSSGGQLWLDRESRSVFEPFSAWQDRFPSGEYSGGALVDFLKQHGWVIDSLEYERDPEHYQHAFRSDPEALPRDSLVFALMHEHQMFGIVRLKRPVNLRDLTFEDYDLLKTAGRQVAAFLANDLGRERLGETQQFEAFNRLSAFVMHDIKNLLAQQALLVNNAKKFRDRPEFVDDVIATVDGGVARMRRLLKQLEQGSPVSHQQRVDVGKLVLRVVSARADNGNIRCSLPEPSPFWVRANPDQLASVLTHVVANAQEATKGEGVVAIGVSEAPGERVLIEIRDDGEGMTEEFIRRKLFKPFETTKGSSGMGIGAYQAREIVRGLGGEMSVTSQVGKGTVVSLLLRQEPRSVA